MLTMLNILPFSARFAQLHLKYFPRFRMENISITQQKICEEKTQSSKWKSIRRAAIFVCQKSVGESLCVCVWVWVVLCRLGSSKYAAHFVWATNSDSSSNQWRISVPPAKQWYSAARGGTRWGAEGGNEMNFAHTHAKEKRRSRRRRTRKVTSFSEGIKWN